MKIASYTRIKKLRELMTASGIDACIIPNTDPHQSEYIPEHWKCIEWLTGFTGEAATVIVTATGAGLWTDSRFFIQGEQQLKGSPFGLMKQGLPGTPSMADFIQARRSEMQTTTANTAPADATPHLTIGFDGRVFSQAGLERLRHELMPKEDKESDAYIFISDFRPFDRLWEKRPALPYGNAELYPETYSGEKREIRLQRIADAIRPAADSLLLSSLEDIAWAFNLRGSDIHCTPVVTAYAMLAESGNRLFIHPEQLTEEVKAELQRLDIEVFPYNDITAALESLPETTRIIAPPTDTNVLHTQAIGRSKAHIVHDGNPIPLMRAVKNPTETAGYRNAMLKDGIALTRFFYWLDKQLESDGELAMGNGSLFIDNEVTELDCVARLADFRKEQPLYREESFDAIVAWRDHAALPHYAPTAESSVPISGDGLLLIDTGGQYLDGTTDITRTLAIGQVSEAMKRDYTLVLKGHIRLATARFPAGTRGDQLDALARLDLWRDGKTYRHGTSHGVGHYLGVHEGPESIRMEHNPQPLLPGMVFSNEPAVYLTGRYGIRHENCVLVCPLNPDADCPDSTPCNRKEMGEFFRLETLTLCYIDTRAILPGLLSEEEKRWLNDYNQRVYDTLAPHLVPEEAAWLQNKTRAL